jgi:hypothetical protein
MPPTVNSSRVASPMLCIDGQSVTKEVSMTLVGEEQAGQILSQDALGRVLVTRERRESLSEEYDRSGMSGVRFAQYVGIKYTTLAYWLKRRRQQR